jgi:hypothetical protein
VLSLQTYSTLFAQHDLQSPSRPYAPIFNTGLPISFPATVGPLVGVVGEGRSEAIGTPFLPELSTLIFGFAWVDSGALAYPLSDDFLLTPLAFPGDCDGACAMRSTAAFNDCGGDREGTKSRYEGVGVGGALASEPGIGGSAGARRVGVV